MPDSYIAKLEGCSPLSTASKALLRQVGQDVRHFPPRHDLIREGEKPDHVLVMIQGWACRYKRLENGARQITAFLVPGDTCDAEIMMFDKMDHNIATLTPSRVGFVGCRKMTALFNQADIARAIWISGLIDAAILRAWIVNLGARSGIHRFAHLICELHARLSNVGLVTANKFLLPLTQEELGDTLGMTGVHINRMLRVIRENNLMQFQKQQVEITDMRGLQRLADFNPDYLHTHALGK